jgi:hypothetical protein
LPIQIHLLDNANPKNPKIDSPYTVHYRMSTIADQVAQRGQTGYCMFLVLVAPPPNSKGTHAADFQGWRPCTFSMYLPLWDEPEVTQAA